MLDLSVSLGNPTGSESLLYSICVTLLQKRSISSLASASSGSLKLPSFKPCGARVQS